VAQGSQFQVNSYTTGNQYAPAISLDSDGDFAIAWHSYGSSGGDTANTSIQGQRYNSVGTVAGSQFQVNTYATSFQKFPDVALDSDGDFVVIWQSNGNLTGDTSNYSIQGQLYNSVGTTLGGQFQVNSYTTGNQQRPSVARDSGGNFVVAWESNGSGTGSPADTSGYSVQGRRFNAGGAGGTQFQANTYTTNDQRYPAVSLDSSGDFVVVWTSNGSSGTDTDLTSIQGRRYNNSATAQGSQFQVNAYTTNNQSGSAVILDSDGDFVIAWQSNGLTPPLGQPSEGFEPLDGLTAEGLTAGLHAPEDDSNYAIAAARFTSFGGPEPTAITLQSASAALPATGGLVAAIGGAAALWATVAGWWLRRRRRKGQQG
jgi:hypothetical protein